MNAKMKVLSLALIGLAGFAGNAVAGGCPASPSPPWTASSALFGTVAISAGGLEVTPSACKMDAGLTSGAGAAATAYVQDDSPANEQRYRAQFLINLDNLNPFSPTFGDVTQVFAISSDTANLGNPVLVQISVVGGGATKNLSIATVCAGETGNLCTDNSLVLGAGTNRVEIDWNKGAGLKVWLNSTDENNPSITLAGDNSGWAGVDHAYLGLQAATTSYTVTQAGKVVSFDAFDSRRQTFIGAGN